MLLWRRARIRLKRMTLRRHERPAAVEDLLRADMLWEVGSGLSCMDLLRGSVRIEMWYLRARVLIALARHAWSGPQASSVPSLLKAARADANRLLKERTLWSCALARLLLACIESFQAPGTAISILKEVEGQFDVIDMRLHVAVTRYRRSQLTPGKEGAQLLQESAEQIRGLGVARPASFVQMLAPGFPD